MVTGRKIVGLSGDVQQRLHCDSVGRDGSRSPIGRYSDRRPGRTLVAGRPLAPDERKRREGTGRDFQDRCAVGRGDVRDPGME